MRIRLALAFVVLGLLVAPGQEAGATPAVITAGSLTVRGPSSNAPFSFALSGPNISFSGAGSSFDNFIGPVNSCGTSGAPCTAVALSSSASGMGIGVFNVEHDGFFVPALRPVQGFLSLAFTGATINIPNELRDLPAIQIVAPVTFSGSLSLGPLFPPDVHPLSGNAFARILLDGNTNPILGSGYYLREATYTFVATQADVPPPSIQAVPEPTTMLLARHRLDWDRGSSQEAPSKHIRLILTVTRRST